jgi:hypothetical protein
MSIEDDRHSGFGHGGHRPVPGIPTTKSKGALARFEKAVRAHAMKGTQPPDQWDELDRRYKAAKRDLANYLPKAPQHVQDREQSNEHQ